MSLEEYLNDLYDGLHEKLTLALPELFYAPVVASLAACYQQFAFEGEEYDKYLKASVKSVADFTFLMLPFLQTDGLFRVALHTRAGEAGFGTVLSALATPFLPLARHFTHSAKDSNRYDSSDHDDAYWWEVDPKEAAQKRKFNEKLNAEMRKEIGYQAYQNVHALSRTPYQPAWREINHLFGEVVPFPMDEEARFQHTWICSPTGTGKTTLLENLIVTDLQKEGASIVVLDSQQQLIRRLSSIVPPERFVLLEPDPDYPLALNLFDNQVIDYSSSLELADFVMTSLLGADLTAKQAGIFRYLTQALQVIPDATILTLRDLLQDGGYAKYRDYIHTLDPYTVDFFETRFISKVFDPTRGEIFWRLDTIMSEPTFRKMFSAPRNKLNLFEELGKGKVICINSNKDILKDKGTELFGRFFIAMILQATRRRVNAGQTSPCFVYIDEAHEYIAEEPKVASLIDQARKQRVAFTFANTRSAQIKNPDVLDAISNVRTKFIAKTTTDAPFFSRLLKVEPDLLMNLPKYRFAFNDGGQTVVLENPPSLIDQREKPYTYREHQLNMREKYCAKPVQPYTVSSIVVPVPQDDIDLGENKSDATIGTRRST